MKAEAAKRGADTIVFFEEEPEQTVSGELFWSARIFR
jgi:hypothetical protein